MQSYISRAQRYEYYKDIDRIHDPHLYDLKPGDSLYLEVDTFRPDFSQEDTGPSGAPDPIERWRPPLMHNQKRLELQRKMRSSHEKIREHVVTTHAAISARTQAHNRKCAAQTIDEERHIRAEAVAAQIKVWRSLLPTLLKQFSRIRDPRRARCIKHKLVTLMVFGLFGFIFRLASRREMNRELTGAAIQTHLKKLFPDLDSIPHADTLARLLETIDPREIEKAHIELMKALIAKKKFKKLLINGCLPISVDGCQKLYRDGLLQDGRWCERKVGEDLAQQYVYVIEVNITFQNGLTIPLLTDYLYRDNNQLTNPTGKQDCEITAFERMAARLKNYFPRLKFILFMDSLYATQGVMDICYKNKWDYLIHLPSRKLKDLAKRLNQKKELRQIVPGQSHYRKRRQEFYWENHVNYGGGTSIHLLGCLERYEEVNKETGDIEICHTDHAWISSIPLALCNVHELYNLGARKKELIEDSINTEKNRSVRHEAAQERCSPLK